MADHDGRLVDVAGLLAQLHIVQRLYFEGDRMNVVAEALQGRWRCAPGGCRTGIPRADCQAYLLQHAHVTQLVWPLAQHCLAAGVPLPAGCRDRPRPGVQDASG